MNNERRIKARHNPSQHIAGIRKKFFHLCNWMNLPSHRDTYLPELDVWEMQYQADMLSLFHSIQLVENSSANHSLATNASKVHCLKEFGGTNPIQQIPKYP